MKLRTEVLKQKLKDRGLFLKDIPLIMEQRGIKVGINAVKSWTRKTNPSLPEIEKIIALCNYFQVDMEELVDMEDSLSLAPYVTDMAIKRLDWIAVHSYVSCGSNEIPKLTDRNRFIGESVMEGEYAIIACGDNMLPEIEDGDEVICRPSLYPKNGDIVHYHYDDGEVDEGIKVFFKSPVDRFIRLYPLVPSKNYGVTEIPPYKTHEPFLFLRTVIGIKRAIKGSRQKRLELAQGRHKK